MDWAKKYPRHWRLKVSGCIGFEDYPSQFEEEAGAHITIFARRQALLDEARDEVLAARRSEKQEVHAVSLDLGNPSEVCPTS